MSNLLKRVIVALILIGIACIVGACEHFGFNAVRYLGIFVVFAMIFEFVRCTCNLLSLNVKTERVECHVDI